MKKILLLAILILVSSFAWSKSFYAEDYYCRLNVRENGDIQVRETIQYRFIGGDFSSISRKIPDKYTDGLQFIRAFVKTPSGDIIQESKDAKITGSHLEVDWDFRPVADTLLNFEVEFIAKKVCYVENGMMYIRWQSVPESHEYLIKKGSVEMLLPRKIEPIIFLFSEDKRVECGYDENQIWWNFSDLKTNQNFVSGIALNEGSLEIEKPEWQALQEEAESLYVDFMRLGVVLVVLIAALLIYIVVNVTVLKKRYSRKDIDEDIYSVHPAMLLYLKQGFIVSNRIYIQIVIRLISKGMLIVKKMDNSFRVFLTDTETEDKLELELLGLIGKKVGDNGADIKDLIAVLKTHKKSLGRMFIKIQKEKGFASSDSFRSLKRCTVVFVIGLFLLIASIAANIFLVSNGILWGLFFSYGIAYILIAIGFKSAGIKLLTDKGLNLKYSSINIGKILVQEIKNDSKVLEEDNFDILLELALLNNDQKKLLKLFKEKEEVNSRGLLSNFDNLIDFWAFIDQVSDQETA